MAPSTYYFNNGSFRSEKYVNGKLLINSLILQEKAHVSSFCNILDRMVEFR